ncbi:MAG TPA: biosynthetic-type acetolactate synthase large subunit [Candidatus Avacidaminococcus intestinavium]|uniref:Acetolactate synthase n=1 Tax=Candidatus Avacidaminococcus intestinavium TaxID=2840684 RepID=A0A9D1SLU1_9FIRM|nr:biosynthetic-type acetolactate synthase large subunit [Candidatus Avacidaminococcus intestinavium]
MTGAEAIVKVLKEQGVKTIFGYPGGQVIPLYNALYDADLHNVLTVHEQGAIHAADGFARATGETGVCIATSGPGATNIVTGLATAYLDSVPLVAITGQVQLQNLGRDAFQEIDIVGVTLPITKHNVLVRTPEELVPALRRAFTTARAGRPGPVLVDIPSNIQTGEVQWCDEMVAASEQASEENVEFDEGALQAAAVVLNNAKRPVLLVGGGAVSSGVANELKVFAEKTGVPVVSTLMGLGVFDGSHPQALGLTGMHGHIAANMAIAEADVLLVVGSRFSERVTGDRTKYVEKKTIIHLDIDPSEIDKNIETTLTIVGDLKKTLVKLNALVKERILKGWWNSIKAWEATEKQALCNGKRLTAPWVMAELNKNFQHKDTIYVTDVGQNQMWAAQHLCIEKPRGHLTSGGCGTMGFGLPAALGAKLARREAQVIHIAGDGGFKMTGMELYTAVNEKLPILSIVLNNACLGMVRQWQEIFYEQRYSSTLLLPFDFVAFAHSCGAQGMKVTTCAEFKKALAQFDERNGPFVIEVVIEQSDLVIPMVAPGAIINDFVVLD